MNKDHFAKTFGFGDYQEMLEQTTVIGKDNDVSWCVSKLPRGRFLAWDDAEIADDRVEVFFSKEEAINYVHILRSRYQH